MMAARLWWVLGSLWLVRARRRELKAMRLKKKAEEFFQRARNCAGGAACEGDDGC